jgi:hypothetical protein
MVGCGHMDDVEYQKIKQTAWKADVLDRLDQVREDVKRAISAAGWEFDEADDVPKIHPGNGAAGATAQGDALAPRQREAQTVVNTTYTYIKSTEDTLKQPNWLRRFWDVLTGDVLMSAYTNLHAAESTRVLLLSSGQLLAILPSIRQRAAAFLPKGDPNSDALATIPDPTVPTHQAVAARIRAQAGQAIGPTGQVTGRRPRSPTRQDRSPARRDRSPTRRKRPATTRSRALTRLRAPTRPQATPRAPTRGGSSLPRAPWARPLSRPTRSPTCWARTSRSPPR